VLRCRPIAELLASIYIPIREGIVLCSFDTFLSRLSTRKRTLSFDLSLGISSTSRNHHMSSLTTHVPKLLCSSLLDFFLKST